MKRKVFALLMAGIMTASLTPCGSGSQDGADSQESAATEDTQGTEEASADQGEDAESSEGGETLTVWCWDPKFNIYAIETAADLYAKDHEGFGVEVTEILSDDIETMLTTAVSAGDLSTLPDIFLMQDNSFQKYVANYPDIFTDLTDSGIDFSQFSQAKVAYSTVDGKNYGIPFDNGASITCLRTDYLEQAGFTVEDFTDITWSEFIEKGKKVLEVTDNDQYIASLNNGTTVGTVNGCWILASVQAQEDQSGKWAVTNIPALDGVENATNYSNNGGSSWVITSNCKNPDLAIDFMNSTFAGSQEFYETILPSSGALSTWLPAGESDVYNEPQEFFGGQAIYADIVEFAGKIPSNITGPFYYDARDAIGVALSNITQSGADIDSEIQAAQDTVEFNMGG